MELIALLLAAAAPVPAVTTPVEAERAFAADAQALGQWTAFRKWAASDAIFLPPEPVAEALKNAKDPARAVDWWPTASFLSCDGLVAANTGGAVWPDGHASYFSTIWARQSDGAWRYRLDHGDNVAVARPRPAANGPAIRRASCSGRAPAIVAPAARGSGGGGSSDGTLYWSYATAADGSRRFDVNLWNGTGFDHVIADRVVAPAAKPK